MLLFVTSSNKHCSNLEFIFYCNIEKNTTINRNSTKLLQYISFIYFFKNGKKTSREGVGKEQKR